MIKFQNALANTVEGVIQAVCIFVLGEHVQPLQTEVHVVKNEAAEQAVLRVRNQRSNLPGCAGQNSGEFRLQQFHKLPVLAPGIGYRLMMEGFSESVAVVAIVGGKDIGQGVALGLEHQAAAVVLAQDLINHCCTGVGRDDERTALGLIRRQQGWVPFLLPFIFGLGFPVTGHVLVIEELQLVLDGLDQASAKRESALAGRCRCRDEEEKVGIHRPVSIDSGEVREAGGETHDGAQDEQVGVFVGVGV